MKGRRNEPSASWYRYIDFFWGELWHMHDTHDAKGAKKKIRLQSEWSTNWSTTAHSKHGALILLPTKLIRCELIIYMISTNLCFDRICLCHLKVYLIGGEYKSAVAESVSCGLVRCRYRVRNPVAANFFFVVVNKGAKSTGFRSNEQLIIYRYLAIFCLALSQATTSLQPTTDRTTV